MKTANAPFLTLTTRKDHSFSVVQQSLAAVFVVPVVTPEEVITTHCAATLQHLTTDKWHNTNNTTPTKQNPLPCPTYQITITATLTSKRCELKITFHNYQSNYQPKLNLTTPTTQILNSSNNNTQISRTTFATHDEEYLSTIQQSDRMYTKLEDTQSIHTHTKCKHKFAYFIHCVLVLAAAEPGRRIFFLSLASLASTRTKIKAKNTKTKNTDPRNRTKDHVLITDRELPRYKRECKGKRPGAGKADLGNVKKPYIHALRGHWSSFRGSHVSIYPTHHSPALVVIDPDSEIFFLLVGLVGINEDNQSKKHQNKKHGPSESNQGSRAYNRPRVASLQTRMQG